ncbi:MAG: guanylate kinase [Sporomusaceae bacterium]|jgi:guanylate kinase|nr:guanylate kinase [Sporomusaceae bacterium]
MNKIFAIIGPPASGKSSIAAQLRTKHNIYSLISHTTRPPEADEQEGVNYYFVEREKFSQLQFVERAIYAGHSYGLSKEEVLHKINSNKISIIDISMSGFAQLKKMLGERVESIYIMVDKDTIIKRYVEEWRDPAEINRRIEYAQAEGEFDNWQTADYVVKNCNSIDTAVRQVLAIMNCPPR